MLPRKIEELSHDLRRPPRFPLGEIKEPVPLPGRKVRLLFPQALDGREDVRKGVVELVRHAGRERPDRGELSRLDKLFLPALDLLRHHVEGPDERLRALPAPRRGHGGEVSLGHPLGRLFETSKGAHDPGRDRVSDGHGHSRREEKSEDQEDP